MKSSLSTTLAFVFAFSCHTVLGQTFYWAPDNTLGGDGNTSAALWSPNSDGSGTLQAFPSNSSTTFLVFNGTPGVVTASAYPQWNTATFEVTGYTLASPFNVNSGGKQLLHLEDNVVLNLFTAAGTGTVGGPGGTQQITGDSGALLRMNIGSTSLTKAFRVGSGPISVPVEITGTNGIAVLEGHGVTSSQGFFNGAISVANGVTLRLDSTSARRLRINANISGNVDVQFRPIVSGNTDSGDISGVHILQQTNYTGSSRFIAATAIDTVVIGINNALPVGTDMIWGQGTDAVGGSFEMNGFNQTVASISSTAEAVGRIRNRNTVTGSTLTINGSSTDTFGLRIGHGGGSEVNDGVVNLVRAGSGTTILTFDNTYTGTTLVTGTSMLIINGDQSAATGAVTVDAGATLGGSGVVGGATTINGILSPGNSTGVLTFESPLTLGSTAISNFEIDGLTRGTEYDAVDVDGLLTYDGDLILALTGSYDINDSWNLFDFGSFAGGFDSVELTGSYVGILSQSGDLWTGTFGGNEWQFNQADGVLSVVPEPSAGLLLLMGLAGLAAMRRRQSR